MDQQELRIYKKRCETFEIEKKFRDDAQNYLKDLLKDSNKKMINENLRFNKLCKYIEIIKEKHEEKSQKSREE